MMEGHSLALQDVAIAPSALAGARADAGIQAPSGKLVIQVLVQLAGGIAQLHLALYVP